MNVDSDAVSIFSLNPSVNLEVDSILMKHPKYIEAYGKVGNLGHTRTIIDEYLTESDKTPRPIN